MLGLISAERPEHPGRLARWRSGWQRGYGNDLEERRLFGRSALFVRHQVFDGPPGRGERRLDDLARLLGLSGVDKVAFSRSFPGRDYLSAGRVAEMDSRYLHTRLAGEVGAYVAERSGATAVCFCRTVGLEEERAILRLAQVFRYLMILTDRDGENVCRNLRRRYGLPVVENPTASQLRRADFALVLHVPRGRGVELGERCTAFSPDEHLRRAVGGGTWITGLELGLPETVAEAIPEGFAPDPILSEAAFQGLVDPGKIKINGVSLDKW